jgi:hypothetical protein
MRQERPQLWELEFSLEAELIQCRWNQNPRSVMHLSLLKRSPLEPKFSLQHLALRSSLGQESSRPNRPPSPRDLRPLLNHDLYKNTTKCGFGISLENRFPVCSEIFRNMGLFPNCFERTLFCSQLSLENTETFFSNISINDLFSKS